jgi:hypothetical protein
MFRLKSKLSMLKSSQSKLLELEVSAQKSKTFQSCLRDTIDECCEARDLIHKHFTFLTYSCSKIRFSTLDLLIKVACFVKSKYCLKYQKQMI